MYDAIHSNRIEIRRDPVRMERNALIQRLNVQRIRQLTSLTLGAPAQAARARDFLCSLAKRAAPRRLRWFSISAVEKTNPNTAGSKA